MDFRLELNIKTWKEQLHLPHRISLIGSCFTEHMANRLRHYRFRVLENPHGILFNPLSIGIALQEYLNESYYKSENLFEYNGLWQSWNHHGRFAASSPEVVLEMINAERQSATDFLRKTDWLIVTLGSSFIYELKDESIFNKEKKLYPVANCHKVPAQNFQHRLMEENEVRQAIMGIIRTARQINTGLKIIFTISPVRHHREGLVENNRSKGRLHSALASVINPEAYIFYFPAYELVVDDLRDYRFYAEDLVHPNYFATRYVWEKFADACIDGESLTMMERIRKIQEAMQHRPRQPQSDQHKIFMQKMLVETRQLSGELPYLNFDDALAFFSA
jgi:hypothetical protein